MLPTVRTRKEDGKNRVISLASILSTSFMVLRMKKLGHFAKYFSCLQRKIFWIHLTYLKDLIAFQKKWYHF